MARPSSSTDLASKSTRTLESSTAVDSDFSLPDHLKLEGVLGTGGMATVLLARDLRLDRKVAIKVLSPGRWYDPKSHARFEQEARAMARLQHPNIVQIHELGPAGDYIVMELVGGSTLRKRLDLGERLESSEVRRIGRCLCDALGRAHAAGIIHRDVKPSNVLFDGERRVVLSDFGIAALVNSDLTGTGALIGTPAYMAPEQLCGGDVDARADVYGAAATLYECVTGAPPRIGTQAPELRQHLRAAGVDRSLASGIARALSTDPDQRYPGADAFGRALTVAPRRWRRALAVAAAALVMVAGGIMAISSVDSSPRTAQRVVGAPTAVRPVPFDAVIDDPALSFASTELPLRIGKTLAERAGIRLIEEGSNGPVAAPARVIALTGKIRGAGNGRIDLSVSLIRADGSELAHVDRSFAVDSLATTVESVAAELARAPGFENPAAGDDTRREAQAELERGIAALWGDRFWYATNHFNNALGFDPTLTEVELFRAISRWWSAPDQVLADMDRLLALPLDRRQRATLEAFSLLFGNRFPDAAGAFGELDRAYPDDAAVLYGLYEASFHGGEPERGIDALRRARTKVPTFRLGLMHALGYHVQHPERTDLDWLETGIESDQRNRYWAGQLLLARRQFDKAGAFFSQMDTGLIAPHEDRFRPLRAWFYVQVGDYDNAERELQNAKDDPSWLVLSARASIAHARGDASSELRWITSLADAALTDGLQMSETPTISLVAAALGEETLGRAILREMETMPSWQKDSLSIRSARLSLLASLGEWKLLRAELASPYPTVRAAARGHLAANAGEHGAALTAFEEALAQRGDGQERISLEYAAAAAARAVHDHRAVAAHCDEVITPRMMSWSWGGLVGRCLLWTGEAELARGRKTQGQAALKSLIRMRDAARSNDSLVIEALAALRKSTRPRRGRVR